jgi:hypothetical protein
MRRQSMWFAVLLIATAACATRTPTFQAPTDQLVGPTIGNSPGPSGGSLAEIHSRVIGDWTAPFAGEGFAQSSLDAAQSLITSFTLHDPQGLGEAQIFVAPDRSPDNEAVMFVYQHPTYGPVWVAETLPEIGNEEDRLAAYEAQVAMNDDPDTHITFEVARIRSGELALLQYSEDPTVIPPRLEWVEDGVQIQVLGPSLTRDDILKIGEHL